MEEVEEQKGSRRKDGTYRKVLKVKPGYIPPHEVEVYQAPHKVKEPKEEETKKESTITTQDIGNATEIENKQKKKLDQVKEEIRKKAQEEIAKRKQQEKDLKEKEENDKQQDNSNAKVIRKYKKKLREIEKLELIKDRPLNELEQKKIDSKLEIEEMISKLSLEDS